MTEVPPLSRRSAHHTETERFPKLHTSSSVDTLYDAPCKRYPHAHTSLPAPQPECLQGQPHTPKGVCPCRYVDQVTPVLPAFGPPLQAPAWPRDLPPPSQCQFSACMPMLQPPATKSPACTPGSACRLPSNPRPAPASPHQQPCCYLGVEPHLVPGDLHPVRVGPSLGALEQPYGTLRSPVSYNYSAITDQEDLCYTPPSYLSGPRLLGLTKDCA